jgi:hypothetical protein
MRLAVLAIAALLVGCAGPQVPSSTAPSATVQKAVVVLSVAHENAAQNWSSTVFYFGATGSNSDRNVKSMEQTLIMTPKSDFSNKYGSLYILDMEPGDYEIRSWRVASGLFVFTPATAPQPLRFSIKRGEVKYIGSLQMDLQLRRTMFDTQIAQGARPIIRDDSAVDIALAESRVPALASKVVVELLPQGEWRNEAGSRTSTAPLPTYIPPPPKK